MPDRFLHAVLAALRSDFPGQGKVFLLPEPMEAVRLHVGSRRFHSQEERVAGIMAAIMVELPFRIDGCDILLANYCAALRAGSRYPFSMGRCTKSCSWGKKNCEAQTPNFGNLCYRSLVTGRIARLLSVPWEPARRLPSFPREDWAAWNAYFLDIVTFHRRTAREKAVA